MMDDEDLLSIETYACLLARLVRRDGAHLASVTGEAHVTAVDFERADAKHATALSQALQRRKGVLAMTFASAFAKEHLRLGQMTAREYSPAVSPTPPTTALPSYLRDKPTAGPRPIVAPLSSPSLDPVNCAPAPRRAARPATPENVDETAAVSIIALQRPVTPVPRGSTPSDSVESPEYRPSPCGGHGYGSRSRRRSSTAGHTLGALPAAASHAALELRGARGRAVHESHQQASHITALWCPQL